MSETLSVPLLTMMAFFLAAFSSKILNEMQPENFPKNAPKLIGTGVSFSIYAVIVNIASQIISGNGDSSGPNLITNLNPASLMLVVFAYPVIEEFVFRGIITDLLTWVFNKLRIPKDFVIASIIASILFIASHFPSQHPVATFITIAPLTVVLARVRGKYGIVADLIIHCTYNLFIVFIGVILSAFL